MLLLNNLRVLSVSPLGFHKVLSKPGHGALRDKPNDVPQHLINILGRYPEQRRHQHRHLSPKL
jgi:hypothetical protein